MKVKDLIMKLIYCDPDKEVRGLFYEFQEEKAVEHELNLQRIDEFDNDIELVFEDLKLLFKQSDNKTFDYLRNKVLEWAMDKDLLHEENADKQFMKFVEEVFEFKSEMDYLTRIGQSSEEIYSDYEQIEAQENMKLEMGDIFVTLSILCDQLDIYPVDCLTMAYEKIKDRTGKTINGVFIKQENLKGD